MRHINKFIIFVSFFVVAKCDPYEDGKYKHVKYNNDGKYVHIKYDIYDDGKYYRPQGEGKYVKGDEGKYTYIYQKGVFPFDGTYKRLEVGDNEYEIYAPRFPYKYADVNALTNTFESPDILAFGEYGFEAPNSFGKFQQQHPIPTSQPKEEVKKPNPNLEAITQYFPPTLKLQEGEKLGTVYNYKGTKVLSTVQDSKPSKLKLEYEVFVRIVDELNKRKK